ncbi:MAG: NADH-quinone oxidoreductase subunit N, partial [Actinomycetes bacterium]
MNLAVIKAPVIDWWALSPIIALTVGAILVLGAGLLGSERLRSWLVPVLAFDSLVVAAVLLAMRWNDPATIISGALEVDNLAVAMGLICMVGGLVAVVLSMRMDTEESIGRGEYHALLVFTVLGMVILIAANDLVTLFAGLELLSISLYVLCAAELRRERSLEAGLKYLIIGSVGSATLLYGSALLYGATGSTSLTKIGTALAGSSLLGDPLLLAGIALMIVGLAFKASVAPFHQWTPDVYEGSPTPITQFMSVATKAAAFGIIVRMLAGPLLPAVEQWQPALAALATISIVVGNFGALGQDSVKRMLAWSSIAQAGYLLAAITVASALGIQALVFYMLVYAVMTIAAFAVVVEVERTGVDGDRVAGFAGLGRTRPVLAVAMTLSMLSLAGLFAGFFGKVEIISALAEGGFSWLAI